MVYYPEIKIGRMGSVKIKPKTVNSMNLKSENYTFCVVDHELKSSYLNYT